ncbi:MAG: hypothetical protein FD138_2317 [Planctomycetota bacterium]|nr:MAG: hypothetical protein FD138_2317 [Planctomycetota bacterium]
MGRNVDVGPFAMFHFGRGQDVPHLFVGVEVAGQIDGGEAFRSILRVVFLDLFSRAIEEFAFGICKQPDGGDLQSFRSRIRPHANRPPAARLECFG